MNHPLIIAAAVLATSVVGQAKPSIAQTNTAWTACWFFDTVDRTSRHFWVSQPGLAPHSAEARASDPNGAVVRAWTAQLTREGAAVAANARASNPNRPQCFVYGSREDAQGGIDSDIARMPADFTLHRQRWSPGT